MQSLFIGGRINDSSSTAAKDSSCVTAISAPFH